MLNTVKAIKERKAKAEKELRDAHTAIADATDNEKRSELQALFDERAAAIDTMKEDLARAERVESLSPEQREDDNTGNPSDGDLTGDDEHRDSPILNPDKHGYSLIRAIRMRADGRELDGVEGEIHQELAKRAAEGGKPASGFMIPHTLRVGGPATEQRSTMVTTDGAGGIPTITANSLIDVLRHRVVMRQMGSQVLSNMVGSFKLPKKTATNSFEWVGENEEATGSKMTVGSVGFSEKTLTGHTTLTRSLLKQSSQDVENMARMDLVDGLAVGLDYAGLAGPAGGDSPVGLLYLSGIETVAMGTNGAAPDWAKIVEMETKVYANDADAGNMGYAFNAVSRGKLKTVEKSSGTARYLWNDDNTVNGYRAATSNQLPSDLTKGSSAGICSASVFGNFADAVFALWGGVDLLVDPFTESKKGNVLLVIHQSADFNVRRTESFSRCLDMLTA